MNSCAAHSFFSELHWRAAQRSAGLLMVESNKPDAKYPCPCCGFLVFQEEPGSYDICPICFWEDDLSQLRFPKTTGANHVSLIEGQANYARAGVCELRFKDRVRAPDPAELREAVFGSPTATNRRCSGAIHAGIRCIPIGSIM